MTKKILFSVCILACALTARAQTKPNRQRAIDFTGKGIISYAADSFDKAISYFDKAIKADTTYPDARFERGNAWYSRKNYTQALKDYFWLARHKTNKGEVYVRIGNIDTSVQDYERALVNYNTAISLDSGQGSYYAARGMAFFNLGKFLNAINDLEKSIQLHYAGAEIYSRLGYCYIQKGDNKMAVMYYDQAIAKNPHNMADYANRGCALVGMHQLDAAKEDLLFYLRYDSADYSIWYNLARAQYGLKQYDSAIISYKKVLRLKPGYGDTWYRIGLVNAERNNYQEAFDDFTHAIEEDPSDPFLYYNRAVAAVRLNNGFDYCADLKKSADMGFKAAADMRDKMCTK